MAEPDTTDRQPAIPQQLVIDVMNKSDGEMCWRYNGVGRGWHARFNPETKYYEVAVSTNVPETTDDGHVMVRVETKEHWYFGRMDLEEWFPEFFTSNRLEPEALDRTPFTGLGEPESFPREIIGERSSTGVDDG